VTQYFVSALEIHDSCSAPDEELMLEVQGPYVKHLKLLFFGLFWNFSLVFISPGQGIVDK